jgi:hypothetical protein
LSADDFQRDRVLARALAGDQLSDTERRILETSQHASYCRCYVCRGEKPSAVSPVHHDHAVAHARETAAELRTLREEREHYKALSERQAAELERVRASLAPLLRLRQTTRRYLNARRQWDKGGIDRATEVERLGELERDAGMEVSS